jgi:hypothetical protein
MTFMGSPLYHTHRVMTCLRVSLLGNDAAGNVVSDYCDPTPRLRQSSMQRSQRRQTRGRYLYDIYLHAFATL